MQLKRDSFCSIILLYSISSRYFEIFQDPFWFTVASTLVVAIGGLDQDIHIQPPIDEADHQTIPSHESYSDSKFHPDNSNISIVACTIILFLYLLSCCNAQMEGRMRRDRCLIDKRASEPFPFPNFRSPSTINTYTTLLPTKQRYYSIDSFIYTRKPRMTSADQAPASCKVVLSKHIANGLLAEVQEGVRTLEKEPHLVGFLANSDPAAVMYAQWTEKTCQEK